MENNIDKLYLWIKKEKVNLNILKSMLMKIKKDHNKNKIK